MSERYFQYIAGPRIGEVLVLDKIEQDEDGDVFLEFKDGSRCNEDLILPLNSTERNSGMLMSEVSDPSNVWKFEEEWIGRQEERWEKNTDGENVCVTPFIKGRKVMKTTPPKKTKTKFGQTDVSYIKPEQQETKDAPKKSKPDVNTFDPVWIMMEKAKKVDTPVSMELTVSLPSKMLYNVAKESFDDGGKKVIEYIINNLDETDLKASLKTALMEAYESSDVKNFNKEEKDDDNPDLRAEIETEMFEPEVIEEPKIGKPKGLPKEELEKYKGQSTPSFQEEFTEQNKNK